jgi:hypothetical protein
MTYPLLTCAVCGQSFNLCVNGVQMHVDGQLMPICGPCTLEPEKVIAAIEGFRRGLRLLAPAEISCLGVMTIADWFLTPKQIAECWAHEDEAAGQRPVST